MDQTKHSQSCHYHQLLDLTNLKADATSHDIETLCKQAIQYKCFAVCIHPVWIEKASLLLAGSSVKICTVIGFPLGANGLLSKAFEASFAIKADEIDMVMNLGSAKEGDWETVTAEIQAVAHIAEGKTVKVIIESCLLTDEEIVKACECAVKGGAHFVKTSTGFSTGGATPRAVSLIRKSVPQDVGVKASGGIKTLSQAKEMVEAGASRLGSSSLFL